jgi:hypothetical protein
MASLSDGSLLDLVVGPVPAGEPVATLTGRSRIGAASTPLAPGRLLLYRACLAVVSDRGHVETAMIPRPAVGRLAIKRTLFDGCLWVYTPGGSLFDVAFVARSHTEMRRALAASGWLDLVR